jgi:hypothetical protein
MAVSGGRPTRQLALSPAAGIALGVVLARRVGIRLEGEVVELARPENKDVQSPWAPWCRS